MNRPRCQVSLDPASYEAVKRIAAASRQSMSSVIADIVDESAPVLVKLAVTLEMAAEAQDSVRRELLDVLKREEPKARAAAVSVYEGIAAIEKAARGARSRADKPRLAGRRARPAGTFRS